MQYATLPKSISAGLHCNCTHGIYSIQYSTHTDTHTHTSAPWTVTDLFLNNISILSQLFIWSFESLVVFKVREVPCPSIDLWSAVTVAARSHTVYPSIIDTYRSAQMIEINTATTKARALCYSKNAVEWSFENARTMILFSSTFFSYVLSLNAMIGIKRLQNADRICN